MAQSPYRVVLDTNTLLRGLVASSSASARVREAAEHRGFFVLLSKPVIDEYRAVLSDEEVVAKFPKITPDLVDITIRRLRFIGEYVRTPTARFEYRRDPDDEKFIELAIELKATHIISSDKDLLSLPLSRGEAGKRFRQRMSGLEVMEAGSFIRNYGVEIGVV